MKEIGAYENKKHSSRSVAYLDLWILIGGQCGGNSDCAADRGKSACVYKDKAELAGAFDGMAPGDSRTVVIKIENQNSHKASFFISQKTTDALEEAGKASGGAYEFQVEIGNDTNRTSLLDADAGGYAENVASAEV